MSNSISRFDKFSEKPFGINGRPNGVVSPLGFSQMRDFSRVTCQTRLPCLTDSIGFFGRLSNRATSVPCTQWAGAVTIPGTAKGACDE